VNIDGALMTQVEARELLLMKMENEHRASGVAV
jgi:hypothetical protein